MNISNNPTSTPTPGMQGVQTTSTPPKTPEKQTNLSSARGVHTLVLSQLGTITPTTTPSIKTPTRAFEPKGTEEQSKDTGVKLQKQGLQSVKSDTRTSGSRRRSTDTSAQTKAASEKREELTGKYADLKSKLSEAKTPEDINKLKEDINTLIKDAKAAKHEFKKNISIPFNLEKLDKELTQPANAKAAELAAPKELAKERHVNNIIGEIAKTEFDFITNANKVIDTFKLVSKENPQDKFLATHLKRELSNIDVLTNFQKEIETITKNPKLSASEKAKGIAMVYQANKQEYFDKLESLINLQTEFQAWRAGEGSKITYTKSDDMENGKKDPIIFLQRGPRHELLLKELAKNTEDAPEATGIIKQQLNEVQDILKQIDFRLKAKSDLIGS